jgi:hypothetical protein
MPRTLPGASVRSFPPRAAGVALAALLGAAAARPAAAQPPTPTSTPTGAAPWPTTRWPTATPAAVGLDAAVLDSLDAEIRAGRYGYVDRLLVIRRGRLAYDRRYRHDYDRAYGDSARAETALSTHDLAGPYNYFNAWWHPYYRGATSTRCSR